MRFLFRQAAEFGIRIGGGGEAHFPVAQPVAADQVVGGQRQPVAEAEGAGEGVGRRMRKIVLEPLGDVFRFGAAPFIDALVHIANHHDLRPAAGNEFQQLLLHLIDILVLVDNDVVHMVAHPVRQLFAGAHGHDRLMDEIGIEADVGGLALRFKDGEGLDEIGEPFIQAQGGKELRRRHGV